jgi:TPR repeat protein
MTQISETVAEGMYRGVADLDERPPRELGMLYAAGRVVARDLVAAHMWFNIAAAKGDRDAAVQRGEVAAEMTKDEIAQALAWARAWLEARAPIKT